MSTDLTPEELEERLSKPFPYQVVDLDENRPISPKSQPVTTPVFGTLPAHEIKQIIRDVCARVNAKLRSRR